MRSPESEDETRPAPEEPAAVRAKSDDPAWPPEEARPEAAPAPAEPKPKELPSSKSDEEQQPAAQPKQEMGLSDSTLHWLVDGEKAIEPIVNDPATAPVYDPRAPVAGRKRTVLVIGGAAIVAFVVAVALHNQAARNRAAATIPPVARLEPAALLTQRAEGALAQGRGDEALELARLALDSDPRFSDAYLLVAKIERDTGRIPEARDAYRKYLELAPLGTHAEEARDALATLPP